MPADSAMTAVIATAAAGRNRRMTPSLILLAATLLAGCSQPSVAPKSSTAADEASQITDRMLRRYREAKSYADHATYVEQAVYRGEGVERELPFYQTSLALQRPNKLRLTFEEALPAADAAKGGCDLASDGQRLRARVFTLPDQFLDLPAPEVFADENLLPDPVLRGVFQGRLLGDVFPQLAMLLSTGDDELIFPADHSPRLLPDAELGGRPCHRVATTNPEGTRVLWIDREDFTLRRMELPAEAHLRSQEAAEMFLKLAVWIDFEEPTFDAGIDAASFELKTPEGARAVSAFEPPAQIKATAKDAKSAKEEADEGGQSTTGSESPEHLEED